MIPYEIKDISQLADKQLETLVTRIRLDRLNLYRAFQEASRIRGEVLELRVQGQIDKQLNMWTKELTKLDKAIDNATNRGNKIMALMLSIDIDTTDIHRLMDIMHKVGDDK